MHGGNDVVTEVVGGVRVFFIGDEIGTQFLPGEDVNAHGGLVAARVGRLLLELGDGAVLVHKHEAETGGLFPLDFAHGDGAGRFLLFVEGQHVGVVHLVDVVAGQHDDVFGVVLVDKVDVLVDGVCGALVPVGPLDLLIGGQDVDAAVGAVEVPGFAVADVVVQLKGLILGEDTDREDARVDAVGQREVDDTVLSAEGDRRFGDLVGQDAESAALAASQKHGDAFVFTCHK